MSSRVRTLLLLAAAGMTVLSARVVPASAERKAPERKPIDKKKLLGRWKATNLLAGLGFRQVTELDLHFQANGKVHIKVKGASHPRTIRYRVTRTEIHFLYDNPRYPDMALTDVRLDDKTLSGRYRTLNPKRPPSPQLRFTLTAKRAVRPKARR